MHVGLISGSIANVGKTTIALALCILASRFRRVVYIDLDFEHLTGTKILRSRVARIERRDIVRLEVPSRKDLPAVGVLDLLAGRVSFASLRNCLYAVRIESKLNPVLSIPPGTSHSLDYIDEDIVDEFMRKLDPQLVIWDFPAVDIFKLKPIIERLQLVVFPVIPGKEELAEKEQARLSKVAPDTTIIAVYNFVSKKQNVKSMYKIPEIHIDGTLEEKIFNIARQIVKYLDFIQQYIR